MAKRNAEIIVPPTIQVMLTGAAFAQIFGSGSPRVVRLTYTDNTTEEAYLTAEEIAKGRDNWFAMVGAVQRTARNQD